MFRLFSYLAAAAVSLLLISSSSIFWVASSAIDQSKQKVEKVDSRVKPKTKKLSFKDALELEKIEEKIILAEAEVEQIENIFSSPDFYEKYAAQTNDLNQKLESSKANVKKLYARWEELERKKTEFSKN